MMSAGNWYPTEQSLEMDPDPKMPAGDCRVGEFLGQRYEIGTEKSRKSIRADYSDAGQLLSSTLP